MSKVIRKAVVSSLLFFFAAHMCAADTASRAKRAEQFAEEAQRALPFAALMPLAWSDAYIGQLVSRKPHFGGGISYGMTDAGFSAVRDLLNDFGTTAYMDISTAMMPPVYGHARIGGFFVPFDIGIAGSIPLHIVPADGFSLEQQTFGGDIRFAFSRDEPKSLGISLGIAYAQTTGHLWAKAEGSDIGIHSSGNAAEIKLQVSKTLWTFTPYLGGGGSFTWSRVEYDAANESGVVTEEWGKEPDQFANGVLFRVFGGVSMKMWVFQLDFNVNFSIPHGDYGAVLGARFQL
ncbi:MAG: hypothetical protein LBK61_03690 [Spirochaetaceae bacterium]|nr:hypothetical protein [Spirochaetaceae bacterium]